MGHIRLAIGYLKATAVHIRVTLGHLKVTVGYRLFFSELHPKVRQTCFGFRIILTSKQQRKQTDSFISNLKLN